MTMKTGGTEKEENKALVHFEHSAQVDRGAAELFTLLVFRPAIGRGCQGHDFDLLPCAPCYLSCHYFCWYSAIVIYSLIIYIPLIDL